MSNKILLNIRYLISIFALLAIISCNKNNDETNEPVFSGFYKIDKITSSELIDLNDDGQFSNNLKNEINYYFINDIYDLEIRPNFTNDYQHRLISFYLPEPYFYLDYPGHPNGYVEYARGAFGISYEYKGKIILMNQSENKESTNVKEFKLLENSKIRATIQKKYYDFGLNEWRNLNLKIIYIKNK